MMNRLVLQATIKATLLLAASAAAAQAPQANGGLEEVVVTGMRANLEKSLDVKKNAAIVLDSINSTELGRFPDADVADSLSHLPGITLQRTTGGEGQKVNIRGFGPQYNIITLNNRLLATDDDGRDIAFDVLPSEVIFGADVLKSSEAAAIEGSIGGTVNLRTASAFNTPGLHGGAHLEGNRNSMSRLNGKKFSAFVSDTVADDKLGFVLGFVHSDNNTRTDSLNAYSQNIYGPMTFPFEGGANAVPLASTPCCITFGSILDDKKRDAFSGSLEWRPSEALTVAADGLFTRLRDPQIGYNQSYYFADDPEHPTWTNGVVKNGTVTSVSVNTFQPEMVNNTINRQVDTSMYGLRVNWKPTDRLSVDFDAYRSVAKRPEGGTDTFVTAGLVSNTPYAQDILNLTNLPHSLPSLNVVLPPSQLGLSACPAGAASSTNPGYCSYTALINSGFLNNNKYWSTHYVGLNGFSVHDEVTGFTLDGNYRVDQGPFSRLRFGVGDTKRDKSRADISNDWNNGSGQYGTLYNTAGGSVQPNPYTFASQGFHVINVVSLPNFMQGAGGSYPSRLTTLDAGQLLAFLKSLDGKPNPFYCTSYPCNDKVPTFSFANTLPKANAFNSYDVSEKTLSTYVQADFEGSGWAGNVGVRVVRTETTAATASAVPTAIWKPAGGGSTVTYNVIYGASQPIGANGKYTLALPSANFSYWVIPRELQARIALAETMSRPNLNELAPTSSNNAINGDPQLAYGGTAGLRPIKSRQADISMEWYYQPHAAFTAALFYKKITDDIYNGVSTNVDLGTIKYDGGQPGTVPGQKFPWTVTAPANGSRSYFSGIELSWQHIMDNGFGAHLQYTYTRSRGYDQDGNFAGAINAVPPTTFTVGLLYEKGPFAADVNWDHSSSFTSACSLCTEVPGQPAISDSFDWVTASVHYKFLNGFEAYVEGKNLTNAIARSYLNGNPLLPWAPGQQVGQSQSGTGYGYSAYGRTYVAGLSYRF